jgi:hypothetical protein
MSGGQEDSWLDAIYEEINATAEGPDEPDVYLSEAQRGLANRQGITPDKFMAGFADWREIRDMLDAAVEFGSNFEILHRDNKGKKQLPTTGMYNVQLLE